MLFSSITFLYYFLPCVLILYLIAPRRFKNVVLFLFSLIFYAWGEPRYVICMLVSIALGFFSGKVMERYRGKAKWILLLGVGIHVAALSYFKFSDILPIGISFYSFQVISYLIDVYREDVRPQRNLLNFATYVSMFPQLVAGPIVRYSDIEKQLEDRTATWDFTAYGIRRFIIGLSKKVLLANTLGRLCEIFTASQSKSVLFYWMYAVAFTLHIYFDFSGYSDMAIGLGSVFGFSFPENFRYPYLSRSVTEFWRRWHISLGSWFRDYVYIPLGGNRVSEKRHILNILIVWALTGLWHGGAWNFLIWGLYFACFLILEKKGLLKWLEQRKVVGHMYTMLIVIVGFVIFNAASLGDVVTYLRSMFGFGGVSLVNGETLYYLRSYAVLFLIGIVGSTPWVQQLLAKCKRLQVLEPIVLLLLLVVSTAFLVDSSFNPFLYFRF